MMSTRLLLLPLLQPLKQNVTHFKKFVKSSSLCTCKYKTTIIYNQCRTLATRRRRTDVLIEQFDENDNSMMKNNPTKLRLIAALNFQSQKDSLPFTKLPVRTLLHIYKVTKNDEKHGYCKNRLYYIADNIKCPPSVLSRKIALRTFIYTLSFRWLENSLKVLLEYNVPGHRIETDLWVLKYHHATIRARLQKVKDTGIDTLYPWMVRCTENILERFISITKEAKDILGTTKSTQAYLANRLDTSPEFVEDMCLKLPALKTIRVTKVKSFLDFLLKEGFDVKDIANKPRVLTASQKTVEQRLEKLRKLGLTEINLNVLCRSRKDFKRYCDSIESVADTNTDDNT